MKNIILKSLVAASIVALGAGFAQAQQTNAASNQLQVEIEITTGCTVNFPNNSGNVNFGSYSAITSNLIETREVVVNCNNGGAASATGEISYSLALNAGSNASTPNDVGTRRLRSGTNYINYNVYQAANQASRNCGGTVWGTNTGETFTGTLTATAAGASNTVSGAGSHYFNVCIPTQAQPALGTYTDVLTATLSY